MATKQRIAYLDFIKGVCIVLLVSFHVKPTGHELNQTFLMPIFFFLSGLNFKTYDSFGSFLRRKVNSLVVPLVFFLVLGTIYYFCRNLLETHFNVNESFSLMPLNPIKNNTPMWFLFVLFSLNIIYYVFVRFLPRWLVIVLSLVLGGVGYWIASSGCVLEPYLDMTFVALPFFMIGNEASKWGILTYRPHLLPALALAAATIVWVWLDTPVINMLQRNYPSPLLLFGMTTMVIFSLFFLCQRVKRPVPVISYFGRYSLIILGTHYFLIGPLKQVFGALLPQLAGTTAIYLITLLLVLVMEYPVIYLLRKYLPRLTAQEPFFYEGWRLAKTEAATKPQPK